MASFGLQLDKHLYCALKSLKIRLSSCVLTNTLRQKQRLKQQQQQTQQQEQQLIPSCLFINLLIK